MFYPEQWNDDRECFSSDENYNSYLKYYSFENFKKMFKDELDRRDEYDCCCGLTDEECYHLWRGGPRLDANWVCRNFPPMSCDKKKTKF